MITEYFVCWAFGASELQKAVNEAIKNGWQPLGGVAVSAKWLSGEYRTMITEVALYQAVVRVTVDDKK